jgi:D-ribose pyranose/furanose isomerase RbsD
MARAVEEIERDILALSAAEKEALLNVLLSELDVPAEEIGTLARQLVGATERSSKALAKAVSRLEQFDEEIRRNRIEARAAVLRSGETWPFADASTVSGD